MVGGEHFRKEPIEQLVNCYLEHLHMSLWYGSPGLPPVQVLQHYMDIHRHTWTALGCKPNSTCKADGLMPSWRFASPSASCRGHHYEETWPRSSSSWTRGPRTDMSRPGIEPGPLMAGGEHSRKKPFKQLVNCYSEHLHMSLRQS